MEPWRSACRRRAQPRWWRSLRHRCSSADVRSVALPSLPPCRHPGSGLRLTELGRGQTKIRRYRGDAVEQVNAVPALRPVPVDLASSSASSTPGPQLVVSSSTEADDDGSVGLGEKSWGPTLAPSAKRDDLVWCPVRPRAGGRFNRSLSRYGHGPAATRSGPRVDWVARGHLVARLEMVPLKRRRQGVAEADPEEWNRGMNGGSGRGKRSPGIERCDTSSAEVLDRGGDRVGNDWPGAPVGQVGGTTTSAIVSGAPALRPRGTRRVRLVRRGSGSHGRCDQAGLAARSTRSRGRPDGPAHAGL